MSIMNYSKIKCATAFTIAEMIIVIGMLGIIAELTFSTLHKSVQNQIYSVSVRKSYNEFNQLLSRITADLGCPNDLKCTGLFAAGHDNYFVGNEFSKYFKLVKNCESNADLGCFPPNTNSNYDGSGANEHLDSDTRYKFISADGMSYVLETYETNCTTNWSTGAFGYMQQVCGNVSVDTNGPLRGPNAYGRDTFFFYITNGKGAMLYPSSGQDDNRGGVNQWWLNPVTQLPRYCMSSFTDGKTCSGKVLEQSWDINY